MPRQLRFVCPALTLTLVANCASEPTDPTDPACRFPASHLVSNFEDGRATIAAVSGRSGGWYTYNDGTAGAVQTPGVGEPISASSPGGCNSKFALRTAGRGFTQYVGVGTDLSSMGSTKRPYNGTAYQGVVFYLKANRAMTVRFKLPDVQVTPPMYGGTCMGGATPGTGCDDAYGKDVAVTTEWQRYQVPFSELTQEGWGQAFPSLARDRLLALQFQLTGAAGTEPWELWIDNVGFF